MVNVLLYYTRRALMLNFDVISYRPYKLYISFNRAIKCLYTYILLKVWLSSHDVPFISLSRGPVDHCTIQRRDKQRPEYIDRFPACCCSVILFEWSSDLADSRPGCFKQENTEERRGSTKMPVFTGMALFHRNTCFCSLETSRTRFLSCAGM